jgi:carotenoid cleavage dioxygenase
MAHDLNSLNPYLNGPFAPVSGETQTGPLKVIGGIPKDFAGVYVRNGPNPKGPPNGMHHWFDGDGMLHALSIRNGEARYRNRYVRTHDLESSCERGGIFGRARDDGSPTVYKDTANTDVVCHGGSLLALWYISGQPVRVDAESLETIRTETFGGALPRNVSAHSKVDPADGAFHFFDYALYEPYYSYGVVERDNRLSHFTRIDLPGPRLPHDMAMTENYIVLMDLPVVFTDEGLRNRVWSIHQDRNLPTRFGVLSKRGDGAATRWFEFPPCYIYHVVNAWEDGDEIVLTACRMIPNGRALDPAFGPYAAMVNVLALRAHLWRWRMNLKTGATREEQVDDAVSEFPVVNLSRTGRKSRWSYHVAIPDRETQVWDGLLKYDLQSGRSERFSFADGMLGSEPCFAPRIGAKEEDDGYVLTFAAHGETGASEALILDAKNFARPPLARVILPQRVPLGFHATWADASEIAA